MEMYSLSSISHLDVIIIVAVDVVVLLLLLLRVVVVVVVIAAGRIVVLAADELVHVGRGKSVLEMNEREMFDMLI